MTKHFSASRTRLCLSYRSGRFLQRADLEAEASCRGYSLNFSIPRVMHQGLIRWKKGFIRKPSISSRRCPRPPCFHRVMLLLQHWREAVVGDYACMEHWSLGKDRRFSGSLSGELWRNVQPTQTFCFLLTTWFENENNFLHPYSAFNTKHYHKTALETSRVRFRSLMRKKEKDDHPEKTWGRNQTQTCPLLGPKCWSVWVDCE